MVNFNTFYFNENAEHKIFCDMDGCITDFVGQYCKYSGMSPEEAEDMYANDILGFWKPVNEGGVEFWSEMEWLDDGKKLWEFILPMSPTILTAPSKGDDCPKGKEIWIKRELGDDIPFIIKRDKHEEAGDNHILIDDTEEKIDKWNEAGGIGILHKSADDTIEQLKNIFGE